MSNTTRMPNRPRPTSNNRKAPTYGDFEQAATDHGELLELTIKAMTRHPDRGVRRSAFEAMHSMTELMVSIRVFEET